MNKLNAKSRKPKVDLDIKIQMLFEKIINKLIKFHALLLILILKISPLIGMRDVRYNKYTPIVSNPKEAIEKKPGSE